MDSESEDSDYIPEVSVEVFEPQLEKVDLTHAKELLKDIKSHEPNPLPPKSENNLEEALRIAKELKLKSQSKPAEMNIKYAGQEINFSLGKRLKPSLDQVLSEVRKPKSLSSLSKSTLDWEKFKEANKLEDSLSQNRKDGYIGKSSFLAKAKEREKDQIHSLKRKKLN